MAQILIPSNIEKYKAIVFDFDGVIVESNLIKRELFFEIWDEYRNDEIIENVLAKKGSRYEIIKRVYNLLIPPSIHSKVSYESYILKYTSLTQKSISKLSISSSVNEIIKAYATNKLLFINSATPEETLKIICGNLKIKNKFRNILGVEQSKIENFKRILKEYNLEASDILFYGDMQSDENAAKSLHIDFIAVYSLGNDFMLS